MKIVNLEEYRKKRETIQKMSEDKSNVNIDEVLEFSAQQGEIVEALLNDISLLMAQHIDIQNQFKIVSAQSFLALEVLQEKGVIMEEELQGRWDALMEKIVPAEERAQEQQAEAPPLPPIPDGSYEPTEEDLTRILHGEDPEAVFAGKFGIDDPS